MLWPQHAEKNSMFMGLFTLVLIISFADGLSSTMRFLMTTHSVVVEVFHSNVNLVLASSSQDCECQRVRNLLAIHPTAVETSQSKLRRLLLFLWRSFSVQESYSHRPDSNISWPELWLPKWTTCSRLKAWTLFLLHYSTDKLKVHIYQFNTTCTVCLSAHNWAIFPALIWLMTSTVWEIRGVF